MAIFRQYVAPLIVVLVFLVALLAVSVRIFIPEDMAAPAPTEEVGQVTPARDAVLQWAMLPSPNWLCSGVSSQDAPVRV